MVLANPEVEAVEMQEFDKVVDAEYFAGLFGVEVVELPPQSIEVLAKADTRFRSAQKEDYAEHVMNYLPLLKEEWIVRDFEQNKAAWLKGWTQNLEEVLSEGPSESACKPKYFRGSRILRLKKDIVVTPNMQLEHDLFLAARYYIFSKYLEPYQSVHELGCGSCGNIWMLANSYPEKAIRGYDWVEPSVKIADEIGAKLKLDVKGHQLDMLHPPESLPFDSSSAVITIHALEQINDLYVDLVETILRSKPGIVVHYEPIVELYDDENLFDYLAKWYSEKRRYLNGLLPFLRQLEEAGKIEVIAEQRPELGGVMHEAALIVWRPIV